MRGRRPRQRDGAGAALTRRGWTRLLLLGVAALLVADFAGGQDWAGRLALGLLAGVAVLRLGFGSMRPLWSSAGKAGPAVDVVDPAGGVPVYACSACGTQLVLLRKGTDRPPRHCGEPMTYTVVREGGADRPDTLAYDDATAAAIPDYPPDDL